MFAALLAALGGTGTAQAHSVVTASTPADGAAISAGPPVATITFDEALQTGFAAMTVVGPDGNLWSRGEPRVHAATIEVDVGPLGPVGGYTIAYRVTSADGHVVSGTRAFTLTAAGTGTPGPPADTAAAGSGSGGPPLWPFLAIAVVVFAGALIFALRRPKRR
ncbi:copper resistance protein CopC [Skermania piniformis]|uniref:Copper resistance protein CopC n=1 Tax=Skermania pinensis TaxID=39122 RepID=A0ABX8SCE7_9ACTN|nr:copper resistance protein CopC [Skermania piniformis]